MHLSRPFSGGQTQSRTFTYDNRGFLTAETLPEKGVNGNGTVTYPSYDARGHVRRSVDGLNDLSFTYDPAERPTDVRVTGAPSALKTFTFASLNGTTPDGTTDYVKGKLQTTSRTNADGSVFGERFYYGGVGGRVSHRDTTWPGQSARLRVGWTDLGEVASLTYPQIAGLGPVRTVCSSYANGFLVGITDVGAGACPGGTSLASLSYHANGMVNVVSHGNLVSDTYEKDPNDMGRPYRISSANALSNWNSGTFEYDGAGNIKALRGTVELVARPAPTHKAYTYDAFGNLTRVTTDDTTHQDLPTSASTNRLTGSGYDLSGNITAWGGYTYTYDPLNAMTTLTGGTLNKVYRYDAEGERLTFREGASGPWTYSLRGLDGKVLREYSYTGSSWSWGKDVVYRQGQLLAAIDSTGTRHFTLDHLGSPRLITDGSRNVAEYHAYWGYGQEVDTACGTERMKFTGHERDNQCSSGALDYMHARYYNPTIGRFLRVDPVRGGSKRPQSWNMYAYVQGNPMKYVDPTGEIFRLAGCDGSNTTQCNASRALLKQALGDAYKYVDVGKGGVVSLAGISSGDFGRLGTFQKGLGALIGSDNTFTLFTGASREAAHNGGGWTTGLPGGGANIYVDPAMFASGTRMTGDVVGAANTTLVHETGHALSTLYPSLAADLTQRLGLTHYVRFTAEAYPMTFENRYRRENGLEFRMSYTGLGQDVLWDPNTELVP